MKPRVRNQLIIGKDPITVPPNKGNLIEEVDVWYVLDDNDTSHNTSGKAGGLKNVNRSKRLKNHDPPKGGLYSNSFS